MPIKATKIAHGQIIKKPGAYRIPIDWYHSQCCDGPSTSSSELRTIITDTPAHAWQKSSMNPGKEEDTETEKKAFILGRAAHHMLLGEEAFSTTFVVRPDELEDKPWNGNRTVCREWLAAQFKAGRTVLTSENIVQIRGMGRALREHPLVREGILDGDVELSLIWKDKATGIWVKSRPDVIPTDSGDFADLKTTSFYGWDIDRQVRNCRYDIQAALVKEGAHQVLGLDMANFSLIFVGVKQPHLVDVPPITIDDIGHAGKDMRCALDTLAYCIEKNDWFGPWGPGVYRDWAIKLDDGLNEFHRKAAEHRERIKKLIAEARARDASAQQMAAAEITI